MYENLYEIAMSIGTSLNLEKMLKRFVTTVVATLECDSSAIFTINNENRDESSLLFSVPKRVVEEKKFQMALNIFKEKRSSSFVQIDELYFYKFNILNFGFHIIAKDTLLDNQVLLFLPEIYIKLGIAVQSAMLNGELNRKVEKELLRHRRRDVVMFQQAKLTSIAELIGNISHQWRQPLNNISILIQDIKDAYDFGELNEDYIEIFLNEAMSNINVMSNTIDNFRNFFTSKEEQIDFEIKEVIEDGLQILEETFSANDIQIIFKESGNFHIFGNRVEFSQAIINILNNAKDVIVERFIKDGKIWITINGENRTISIEDNGGGINEEIMSKVFEPYFTTKHQSSGTGIGLYMSKITIEKNFHGILNVVNSEKGAKFGISFSKLISNEENLKTSSEALYLSTKD
jgi:signal transduction histidine kinase